MDKIRRKSTNRMPEAAIKDGDAASIVAFLNSSSKVSTNDDYWFADGRIGSQLRSIYADIIHQPLPERLGELVHHLGKTDDCR